MGVGGRARRWLRWVQNPVATVAALIVLAFEVWMLPGFPAFSTSGLWLRYGAPSPWGEAIPTHYGRFAHETFEELYAVREGDGWRLIDPDVESFDELAAILERGEPPVVYVRPTLHHYRTGFWAITSNETGHSIQMDHVQASSTGKPIEHADELAIRSLVAERLPFSPWIDRVRTSDAITGRVVWGGVAHNAVSGLAALALLVSLGWVPRAPGWVRERLADRALARGRCPGCGYGVADLDRCPECGRDLPVHDQCAPEA